MRACLDGIGSSLPLRRESKLRYIVSDVEAARSLDFYSISFHLSLLPPSVLHPYPRRPHPSTSLRALPFHAIDFPFAKRKNVSSADSGGGGGEELNFAAWISRYEENDDLRVQNPFTTITIAVGNRHARTKGNSNKSETRSRPSFERTMDGWLMHAVPT